MATQRAAAPEKFSGFPKEAVQFYRDVEKNNTREWFEQHRDEYIANVVAPAQAFVNEVGPKLKKLRPGVGFNTDPNGKGSIKKIHTDSRFVKNRPPLKAYLDIMFWEGPLAAKKDNSAFYFHLDPQRVMLFCGIKGFDRPVLNAYRQALGDEKAGKELLAVVNKLRKGGYEIKGSSMKQLPRGFDKDAPWAELALHEALFAAHQAPLGPELHSAKLEDFCLSHWKAMAPLHNWLVSNVLDRL